MLVRWHKGVGADLVGAGASSSTEGGLEGLPGSGASSCPTHTKWGAPGAVGTRRSSRLSLVHPVGSEQPHKSSARSQGHRTP